MMITQSQPVFTLTDNTPREILTISDKQMLVRGEALLNALYNNTLSDEDWLLAWVTVCGLYNRTADRHAALVAAVLASHWNEAARLAREDKSDA